jgi:hypothetical protein
VGTFNLSATILSKKDSSTMLPELTEFVPAIRMGIVRKVLLGLHLHIQNSGSKRIWILTYS